MQMGMGNMWTLFNLFSTTWTEYFLNAGKKRKEVAAKQRVEHFL